MVCNRCASCPPYPLHFCTRPKVQPQENPVKRRLALWDYHGLIQPQPCATLGAGHAASGEDPRWGHSLHPNEAKESRTEPTLTFATKDRGLEIEPPHDHRAAALFTGGTGDKKSYYLAGPYRNIAYALDAFDQRLEEAGPVDGYQSLYLGYHEVWSASAIGRLVAAEVHAKSASIYIVGHSLGAWSGAHLSQRLSEWGYRVEMLVTLDPVGSGLLVRLGSWIPYPRPAPRSHGWVNVRPEPGLPPQLLAID